MKVPVLFPKIFNYPFTYKSKISQIVYIIFTNNNTISDWTQTTTFPTGDDSYCTAYYIVKS